MSSTEIRHRARKRFGQHFLNNGRIADRIVDSADLSPDDTVIEIGPGTGMLTMKLLERAGSVIAVEIDRDLASALRNKLGGEPRFQLIEQDILTVDLSSLPGVEGRRVKVVANIPYNITSPIIDLILANREVVGSAVLMMQREVAHRLAAGPGSKEYGLLSLNAALFADTKKLFDVKPGSFTPPPEVTSTVVCMTVSRSSRFPLENESVFRVVTGQVFRQRRKMIRNTLPGCLPGFGVDESEAAGLLAEAEIKETVRPERVPVDAFVRLSNVISARAATHGQEHD